MTSETDSVQIKISSHDALLRLDSSVPIRSWTEHNEAGSCCLDYIFGKYIGARALRLADIS